MRERTANDGTVTFQVLFRDGKKQRSKTFDNSKSAESFADMVRVLGPKRALAELDAGPGAGMTLDALAEEFFTWKASRVRSDRTVADYRRDYDNWIRGALGWRAAVSIDEIDVQDWTDSMVGRISAKSIHDRHAILHGIFKYGSSPTRTRIPAGHNPAIGTEMPRKVRKPIQVVRNAEWIALYRALQQIDSDAADFAEFIAATGWRISEATALSSHDVEDMGGDYVRVTVGQVARRAADGTVKVVQDTKSVAGQRGFRIDADASSMVRRRVVNAEPGGLVFTTSTGAMWNYSNFRSRYWTKAIKLAGLQRPLKIHWLRHLHVGQLDAAGVSPAKIKNRIGHESINTTLDVYGSMIDDVSDDVLDQLAAMRRGAIVRELPEATFEIAD